MVVGDFNAYNKIPCNSEEKRRRDYSKRDYEYRSTQLIDRPTQIPSIFGLQKSTLDPFLTSHLQKYEVKILAPFGHSDHCTISASFSYANLRRPRNVKFLNTIKQIWWNSYMQRGTTPWKSSAHATTAYLISCRSILNLTHQFRLSSATSK